MESHCARNVIAGFTVTAQPAEADIAFRDFKFASSFDPIADIREVAVYIINPPTCFAYKVIVFMAIVVVVRRAMKTADIEQHSGICHLAEVSVYCCLAYRRVFLHDKVIYLLSCCMDVQLPNGVIYQLSLNCIPFRCHG